MKVSFYGDSTMYGSTVEKGTYVKSPFNIPATVQVNFPSISVENKAIGGTRSDEWLWGRGQVTKSWEHEMGSSDADIVVINTGINDVFFPQLSYADYQYCYTEFARIAASHNKQMVFQSPNMINHVLGEKLWDWQHRLKDIATQIGIPHINQWDTIAAAVPQWWLTLPDGIHPGNDLYKFMGQTTVLGLTKLINGRYT